MSEAQLALMYASASRQAQLQHQHQLQQATGRGGGHSGGSTRGGRARRRQPSHKHNVSAPPRGPSRSRRRQDGRQSQSQPQARRNTTPAVASLPPTAREQATKAARARRAVLRQQRQRAAQRVAEAKAQERHVRQLAKGPARRVPLRERVKAHAATATPPPPPPRHAAAAEAPPGDTAGQHGRGVPVQVYVKQEYRSLVSPPVLTPSRPAPPPPPPPTATPSSHATASKPRAPPAPPGPPSVPRRTSSSSPQVLGAGALDIRRSLSGRSLGTPTGRGAAGSGGTPRVHARAATAVPAPRPSARTQSAPASTALLDGHPSAPGAPQAVAVAAARVPLQENDAEGGAEVPAAPSGPAKLSRQHRRQRRASAEYMAKRELSLAAEHMAVASRMRQMAELAAAAVPADDDRQSTTGRSSIATGRPSIASTFTEGSGEGYDTEAQEGGGAVAEPTAGAAEHATAPPLTVATDGDAQVEGAVPAAVAAAAVPANVSTTHNAHLLSKKGGTCTPRSGCGGCVLTFHCACRCGRLTSGCHVPNTPSTKRCVGVWV